MEKNSENIIELTKQSLEGNDVTEELKKEIEKELTKTGKLSKLYELLNDNKLDMEKFEFMLRLISNDEELYTQINKLKKLKETKQTQTDLETLKANLEETKETLKQQISSLNLSVKTKTNIPVLKTINKKIAERKNKDILKTKLDLIIETIKQSRLRTENKELKEQCTKDQYLKETLDLLYKHCELGNIDEINKIEAELEKKYKKILSKISEDIEVYAEDYRKKRQETEKFDQRLREYTFNKKNNYITASIERWSKKNYINYDYKKKKINVAIPEEEQYSVKLIVYGLVGLYQINKNNTNKIDITYVSNDIKNKLAVSKEQTINSNTIKTPSYKKIDNTKKKK